MCPARPLLLAARFRYIVSLHSNTPNAPQFCTGKRGGPHEAEQTCEILLLTNSVSYAICLGCLQHP